ncbi:MAG: hypothetical protein R6W31_20230, partial [Bacteroidales bacterium]
MKRTTSFLWVIVISAVLFALSGCSKDRYLPDANGLLKKIIFDGYITEEISYNQDKIVDEVHSTSFYRKFHYNQFLKLTKEEVAVSPDLSSSSITPGTTHEFVDPDNRGHPAARAQLAPRPGRVRGDWCAPRAAPGGLP